MTYRHTLSFLLGLEGVALLRAHAGDAGLDEAFTQRRLAEIEAMLRAHSRGEFGHGRHAVPISTAQGYQQWSSTYDSEHNPLIAAEEPVVQAILAALPVGRAVDAACGTGRHAALLASKGHQVTGVDSSPHMLSLARQRMPKATFHEGDLEALPLGDASADLVVCGLALAHVADLRPVFAEFARVLAAQGHLVISDIHILSLYLGGVACAEADDGTLGLMPASRWKASDYVQAAIPTGFNVRACGTRMAPFGNRRRADGPSVVPRGRRRRLRCDTSRDRMAFPENLTGKTGMGRRLPCHATGCAGLLQRCRAPGGCSPNS